MTTIHDSIRRRGARAVAYLFCLCFVFALCVPDASAQPARERASFNADWRFQRRDPAGAEGALVYERIKGWINATGGEFVAGGSGRTRPEGNVGEDVAYTRRGFDDGAWRRLNLPHDWGIEGPFDQALSGETGKLPWAGVGWYRKRFHVAAGERGRQLYLDIDGAMAYSAVWLNGQLVGGWPYGYASFRLDLTPYVEYGAENVLAIRLDNPPESSRWYPGAGLYRNVWLVKTAPVHVGHWGTYATTPEVTSEAATVDLKVTVDNRSNAAANVTLRTELYELGADGRRRAKPAATFAPAGLNVAAGQRATVGTSARVRNPKLWGVRQPNLYAAVTSVEHGGKVIDRYETVLGIRTIKFDAARGFLLNGEPVRMNGVCQHHDLGALGSAINTRALERQFEILKEMGVNAVRTSHNPPAPELLDLADRMGLLIMDEAFDAWRRSKKKNDYSRLFDDWHEKDLRALV
ncbi:MAG TPA: glycoside hydrolase family 2 TIM barrel-domain containing protein, partial [Pyrinomonadaceae bacterium]